MHTFNDENDENLRNPAHIGWFKPLKWNHACFDALYRVSRDKLRVVQITVASSHSSKLKYLVDYVRTMEVSEIEFVVVCRRKNFDSFKVFDPTTSKSGKEIEQYKLLLEALNKNCVTLKRKKTELTKLSFQKVCYEK